MDNHSILVTGGLGYVGGRIAQHLASNLACFLRLTSRHSTIVKPAWLVNGEIAEWDAANDPTSLFAGVDTIIHLAALNEIDSTRDPLAALEINGLGTLRLLKAAEAAGISRFIFFSTAHIYGAPLVGAVSEATLPRPVHPYAISHKVAEDFVLAARDQGNIDGIVLRLSNGFGAPIDANVNRWSLVFNDLCRQAVTTATLTLRSSGLQQRDFITLEDTARCAAHFMSLPKKNTADGLFNLGGEFSHSIYEIAQLVAARCETVLGFLPDIHRVEPIPGEQSIALDYSIAKLKATGFSLQSRIIDEVDATLLLCQNAFGKR